MTSDQLDSSCVHGSQPHPLLAAVEAMAQALDSVSETNPTFMSATHKAAALAALARVESRTSELRLRVLADADDVADAAASRDPADWFAQHCRTRAADARRDQALGQSLESRYPALRQALRQGSANLAQARVIAHALDRLHAWPSQAGSAFDDEVLARAEQALVDHCADFGPDSLARLGRRIIEVVAPEIAENAEAQRLTALEAEAHRATTLSLRRVGDGTTRLSGLLPDSMATRLATYLEAFTSPRHTEGAAHTDTPRSRLPHPRKLGAAFCQLMESLDPRRLPVHGGDATTLTVTVSLDALRTDLAAAGLLGNTDLPGATESEGDGETITASEARRLACMATIIPVVLDGDSLPLDLGRARRLFSPAQRRALLLRDRVCRAEGCSIPGTWTEAHHWVPWLWGGATDLANGVLLCAHHHHRAHDPGYRPERLPNGDVRFNLRR